jgi:hypothetical protein
MGKALTPVLLGLLLIAVQPIGSTPPTRTATLVEVISTPMCAGLDCPPWPMPMSVDVCMEIDGEHYTAMYHPWNFPWVTSGQLLLERKGKSIQVVMDDNRIKVLVPRMNTALVRMHHYRIFQSSLCNAA